MHQKAELPSHGFMTRMHKCSVSPLELCTTSCSDADRNVTSATKRHANSPMASLLSRSARDILVRAINWHVRDNPVSLAFVFINRTFQSGSFMEFRCPCLSHPRISGLRTTLDFRRRALNDERSQDFVGKAVNIGFWHDTRMANSSFAFSVCIQSLKTKPVGP